MFEPAKRTVAPALGLLTSLVTSSMSKGLWVSSTRTPSRTRRAGSPPSEGIVDSSVLTGVSLGLVRAREVVGVTREH